MSNENDICTMPKTRKNEKKDAQPFEMEAFYTVSLSMSRYRTWTFLIDTWMPSRIYKNLKS